MPSYDLACDDCETRFETFRQGFLRDEDRVCPECGSVHVTQQFTGFVTARPSRADTAPTITGFGGQGGCCGGACGGH
ncbi:MAG: zinc ribbon domain-containing protein [Thermoleophilia bacterium]